MLFFVAGKIADQTTLEWGIRNNFNLTDFRSAFAKNYGGEYTDYYIYSVDESNAGAVRAMKGDEFVVVWEDGAITGLDFTPEDTYRIMRFEPRDENGDVNDTLIANGVDYVDITATVWDPTLTNIDTSFNSDVFVPIINPDKKLAEVKITFTNGVSVKRFKTTEYGTWNIPTGYKFKDQKIKITNEMVLDIHAIMNL
jgi:hypothetical protein